jgi:peptide-methionine (S)-S-oxide reductase
MISRFLFLFVVFFTFSPTSIGQSKSNDTIVLGAGCFWCVEAVFQELKGVRSVESGYAGGHVSNPSYKAVCDGTTGHAEVARIVYNPAEISFEKLLSVFFLTHDPTTLNRQGADIGTQYRSAIFYTSIKQKEVSLRVISDLDRQGAYPKPIVTEVKPLQKFWPAENYHQDYYDNNPNQGYCKYVIQPKLEKFRKVFKDELK